MARKKKHDGDEAAAAAGNGPPADESKHARFMRLAIPRVNRARKAIALIGNLASSGYESSDAERDQIVDALLASVNDVKAKLAKKSAEAFAFK